MNIENVGASILDDGIFEASLMRAIELAADQSSEVARLAGAPAGETIASANARQLNSGNVSA